MRFVAIKMSERRPEEVGAVMSATLLPVLVLAVLTAAALWFTLPLVPLPDDFGRAARLLALFLPVASVSNLVLAGTRGLGSVRPTVMVESLLRQGLQPVLAGIAALTTERAIWLALAWVVPYALSAGAGVLAFRRLPGRRGVGLGVAAAPEVVRRSGERFVIQRAAGADPDRPDRDPAGGHPPGHRAGRSRRGGLHRRLEVRRRPADDQGHPADGRATDRSAGSRGRRGGLG
ncbi:MAG: hypothetical protein R2734_14585 [Nocardioides sp.]